MDLESFIFESLTQIQGALNKYKQNTGYQYVVSNDRIDVKDQGINGEITFDIALIQSSSQEGKGKGGLMVANFGVGGEGSLKSENENTSRIKFTVRLQKIENTK